jgi:anti-anti-sigma regulatory factor
MLKITTHVSDDASRITLEGRLAGPWIGELERCWRESEQSAAGRQLIVDLTGVTFVEQQGKALLSRMCQSSRMRKTRSISEKKSKEGRTCEESLQPSKMPT